jgi:hypothetical protein
MEEEEHRVRYQLREIQNRFRVRFRYCWAVQLLLLRLLHCVGTGNRSVSLFPRDFVRTSLLFSGWELHLFGF